MKLRATFRTHVLWAFVTVIVASARADGVPYGADGRYTGAGATTVIEIGPIQRWIISNFSRATLTPTQAYRIWAATGIWSQQYRVLNSFRGENDCTCDAPSVALRFESNKIEVIHAYLKPNVPWFRYSLYLIVGSLLALKISKKLSLTMRWSQFR
jgi:hypothetical protein